MGYLDPAHPIFDAWPATHGGRGVHTDEASSALPDLRRVISGKAWHKLDEVASVEHAPRANPAEGEEDERGAKVQAKELLPLAYLATGMWGPDGPHTRRETDLGRRLPLFNPRDPADFASRMRVLQERLEALHATAERRYRASGQTTGPWLKALAQMRAAVAYVRAQLQTPAPSILGPSGVLGLGAKGKKPAWGVLAVSGNKKLPFVAYSELPMATCPGAGACGVPLDYFEKDARRRSAIRAGGKAWCYSFKAFRYPDAFARQFLNTLASYADREFAIVAAGGPVDPAKYEERAQAALRGTERRVWPQFVKGLALAATRKARADGRRVFMRLFVDGDLGTEDNIVEWMVATAQMGLGSPDVQAGNRKGAAPLGHVEVYGYSKCWQQLLNVDRYFQGRWPANYTVNLSSGSIYAGAPYAAIRAAVEKLPIARGYFEAIPIQQYVPALAAQVAQFKADPQAAVPMPSAPTHFAFSPDRIRTFLRIQGVDTWAEAVAVLPDLGDSLGGANPAKLSAAEVRHLAYAHYLSQLVRDPAFGALVRREIVRDRRPAEEKAYLADYERKQREALTKAVGVKTPHDQPTTGLSRAKLEAREGDFAFTAKQLHDKTLALVLHEVLWTYGLGGSCPLVCGSCSSHPTDPALGAHRCADRTLFQGKVISIGLH